MIDYRTHYEAQRTLRLAKKSSLELPSDELGYQCRLAKKRLHTDRLALKSSKPSRIAEDTREPSVEEELED